MTVARATEEKPAHPDGERERPRTATIGLHAGSLAMLTLLGASLGAGVSLTPIDDRIMSRVRTSSSHRLKGPPYNKSGEAARRLRQSSPTPVSADARSHEAPTRTAEE